jgi:hypothetical protein
LVRHSRAARRRLLRELHNMASITEIADKFFVACETGKGWEACKDYCTPGATFAAQAEPLADVKSLGNCYWAQHPG